MAGLLACLLGLGTAPAGSPSLENVMRTVFLLILLAIAILATCAARGAEEDQIPARVLCDGGRLAAIQFSVPEAGVYTLRIPVGVCGRVA